MGGVEIIKQMFEPTHHLFDETPERDTARVLATEVLRIIAMTYYPGPFNDDKFHVDVDFLVPPKSPDFNLDYAKSVMPPPAPTTVYSRYESQQFSLNILSRIPSQFILNSKNSFNFRVMIILGKYFVMVDQIVAEFLCCGTSEYRKYIETGFSDIGHHMFVEIPLSIIQLLSSIPFPPKPSDPCFWLNNPTMLPPPSFKMWEYLIYKAKEEGSKSTGSKISRLFWHGGSAYDAWFSCASNQVAQVLLTLCYNMMLKLYAQKGKFEKLDRSIPNSAIPHELETRKIFLFGLSQGAGIFDGADQRYRQSLPLGKQVEYYSNVYEELTPEVGETALQKQLSKLIFVMMIGSNDLFGYFESSEPLDFLTPQDYVDSMIFSLRLQLQRIYANGGRKFEIAGVGVIGCCPASRLKNKTECGVETNYWSAQYKKGLQSILKEWKFENEGIIYSYFDTYAATSDLIQNPTVHEFTDVKAACCGLGELNAIAPCLPVSNLVLNRQNHVLWDQYHPTKAAPHIFADGIFDGPSIYMFPINMRQLVAS
ncbi:uncharacterized protein LOC131610349 [Vicia villosa]|uniref:uncharacterized protein LOC131610349 n=1 Tax=Vicia villosa TaxID=3911 RepID=UPI00273CBDC3|nr:uncharacterized protein LOC131610349 [Vicia villosa]